MTGITVAHGTDKEFQLLGGRETGQKCLHLFEVKNGVNGDIVFVVHLLQQEAIT